MSSKFNFLKTYDAPIKLINILMIFVSFVIFVVQFGLFTDLYKTPIEFKMISNDHSLM